MERQYAPYMKWLGTAFARLGVAPAVRESLERAVDARDFSAREQALGEAFEAAATRHNALGLTEPLSTAMRPFHERPYRVIGADRFVEACLGRVENPWLRSLPLSGSIDQLVDSTDGLTGPAIERLRSFYEAPTGSAATPGS